jgi:hypothetical protein
MPQKYVLFKYAAEYVLLYLFTFRPVYSLTGSSHHRMGILMRYIKMVLETLRDRHSLYMFQRPLLPTHTHFIYFHFSVVTLLNMLLFFIGWVRAWRVCGVLRVVTL